MKHPQPTIPPAHERAVFLTARWSHLAMLNYEVEPSLLASFVPPGTELDFWDGRTFVSVVGFLFLDTRVWGIPVPFHRNFEEVNLRFYVRRKSGDGWRRGVVFIKELVPRLAIAWAAKICASKTQATFPRLNCECFMKAFCLILCVALLTACVANGQGTFIYDQQDSTNAGAGGGGSPIQEGQPMGQSFTPTLSSVGFVQLEFMDFHPGNGLGATVFLNLWSGSISNGTLLSSTEPVFMPDDFGSGTGGFGFLTPTNFFFSTPVSVTPGTTYFIQPVVVQPGSDAMWDAVGGAFNYSGGTFYFDGAPNSKWS